MLHLFPVHKVSHIENLGSFSIWVFSRKCISAKIYPNKFAALEQDHAGMLVLQRLRCNVVNDLSRFISVEALSQSVVFF